MLLTPSEKTLVIAALAVKLASIKRAINTAANPLFIPILKAEQDEVEALTLKMRMPEPELIKKPEVPTK